jgi:plasmid stabilization system protein ParE
MRVFWTEAALKQLGQSATIRSYRIIYLIKDDRIEVLAVMHTSRRELPQEE